MSLKCPDCNSVLRAVYYEGVRVYLCLKCQSFFLKPKELKRIQDTHEVEISIDMTPPSRLGDNKSRICPACDIGMKKKKYGKVSSTIIDLCEKCNGIWLDKGELERIQLDYEIVQGKRSSSKPIPKENKTEAAVATAIIQCPKCSHEQPETEECSNCGIIFAKFTAQQREVAAAEEDEKRTKEDMIRVLKSMRGVEIHQTRDLVEGFIGFERKNHYAMHPVGSTDTWHAFETGRRNLSWLWRNLFGSLHRTEIQISDPYRNMIMRVVRRVRLFFGQCDLFSRDGKKLGTVSRVFAPFNRWFVIRNALGIRVMRIKGPVFSPWTFIVFSGGKEVARIQKKWSGWFTEGISDADRYSLRFSGVMDVTSKQLLMGAAFLIDYMYFESFGEKENLIFRTWRSSPLLVAATLGLLIYIFGISELTEFFKPPEP